MTLYIANSFSLNMLPDAPRSVWVYVKRISIDEAKSIIKEWKDDIKSVVGHQATAEILSLLLNMKIEVNRVEVKLDPQKDAMIVFQLKRRLAEGQILKSREEIEAAGYDLYYVIPTPYCQ
jgi:hypothetical protein